MDEQLAIPFDMPAAKPSADRLDDSPPQTTIEFAQMPTHWGSLAFPELIVMPRRRKLADMARYGEPIIIGRTLIRVHKVSGVWKASLRDLQEASRDLAALRGVDLRQVTTLSAFDGHWQADLIETLEDARRRTENAGKDIGPYGGDWFWIRQWGCMNLSLIARHDGPEWTIPSAFEPTIAACRAVQVVVRAERDHCIRCGGTVEDFYTDSIATETGWQGLCPQCQAAHTGALAAYTGHLRDTPYARVRDLENESAHKYRCVVCSWPAAVWDHCHEHGFVRGPLCSRCNLADSWFGSPFLQGAPQPPIKHIRRCKACAEHGLSPDLRVGVVSLQVRRMRGEPVALCHPQDVKVAYPSDDDIAAALAAGGAEMPPVTWSCGACGSRWESRYSAAALSEFDRIAQKYLRDGKRVRDPGWQCHSRPVRVAGPASQSASAHRRARPVSIPAQIRFLAGRRHDGVADLARSLEVSEQTLDGWLHGRPPTPQNRSRLAELVDAKLRDSRAAPAQSQPMQHLVK
jgi:hypothetical protein